MLWMIRMWFLRMWIIHMWIIDIWLFVAAVVCRVHYDRGEGGRIKAGGNMLQAIGPGVRKDAIEVAAKRAVRPALTVNLQDSVALDSNVL